MAAILPALIGISYLQLLGLPHPYLLLGICLLSICSFIVLAGFPGWAICQSSHIIPTVLCSVSNFVAWPAPNWAVGTSNTSLIHFISPCLSISLTVSICLLIFKSSCWCVWSIPSWLTSLTGTFMCFVSKPTASVASQCVTCGSNMSDLIACPTSHWDIGASSPSPTIHSLVTKVRTIITITIEITFIPGSWSCFLYEVALMNRPNSLVHKILVVMCRCLGSSFGHWWTCY